MSHRLQIGGAGQYHLRRRYPLRQRLIMEPGAGQMMGNQFWLCTNRLRKAFLKNRCDRLMQLLATALQQTFISRILHKCVLEYIVVAATINQLAIDKLL